MKMGIEVKTGDIDDSKVLKLLNSTRGSWGDLEFLRWIFYDIPTHDKEENFFAKTTEGKIVGYGRTGHKNIVDQENNHSEGVFEYKHASVLPDYQGLGIYSKIIESRLKYFSNSGIYNYKISFIRKGNLPFGLYSKKGWKHRVLPLYMFIVSPCAYFLEYVNFFKEQSDRIYNILLNIGRYIDLVFSDEKVNISKAMGGKKLGKLRLKIYVSDTAMKENIEMVTSELNLFSLIISNFKLATRDEISLFRKKMLSENSMAHNTLDESYKIKKIDISDTDKPEKHIDIDNVVTLYNKLLKNYDISFRRDKEDIVHILRYPKNSEVILVEDKGDLLGFSVLGYAKEKEVDEIWVLDQICKSEDVFHSMINYIEKLAVSRRVDSVRMYSEMNPGDKWAYLPITTLMWDGKKTEFENKLKNGKLFISQYDVL